MSCIKVDGTVIRIDPNRSTVATCTDRGTAVAGVEAIEVGAARLSGVVGLEGAGGTSLSVAGGTITITSTAGSTSTLLRELADVAITTDGNGDPIIPEGAVLRWTEYETGGVWIASDTLDGGSY